MRPSRCARAPSGLADAVHRSVEDDLLKYAKKRGISLDRPWRELTPAERAWVIDGEGKWEDGVWYGAKRFFAWLETKAYKMHVRVLLSRYRAYTPCDSCDGARLKTHALLWRLGSHALASATLAGARTFRPRGVLWSDATLEALPGLSIHDLMLLPIERVRTFFQKLELRARLMRRRTCCSVKSEVVSAISSMWASAT